MDKKIEKYDLNISKQILDAMGVPVSTENKTFSANSLEELNSLLKLSGLKPITSSEDSVDVSVDDTELNEPEIVDANDFVDEYLKGEEVTQPTTDEVNNNLDYMKKLSGMVDAPSIIKSMQNDFNKEEMNFDAEHSDNNEYTSCSTAEHVFCNDPNCGCDCHSKDEERLPENPYLTDVSLSLDGYDNIGDIGLWKAQNYEKMLQIPASNWPVFLEELNEYLIQNGYTKEQATNELMDMMNLEVVETFDYGLRDIENEKSVRTIKGFNNNKSNWNRTEQLYVQARYGDNPMDPKGLHENNKNFENLYRKFLKENDKRK